MNNIINMSEDNFYIFKRLIQARNARRVYQPGERTPYPIIVERPSCRDTILNMGLPEWTPFLVSIPLGIVLGHGFSFNIVEFPLSRRIAFTGMFFATISFGFFMGVKGSFYKLLGFEDNGLRWKVQEERVKKYEFTQQVDGFWEDLLKSKTLR